MIIFTKHSRNKFEILKRHKFLITEIQENNMKNKDKAKISYEPDADVLMWEITDKPIDYAKEIGNIVVHFTKDNNPVLIEILEASRFLSRVKNLVQKTHITMREPALTP